MPYKSNSPAGNRLRGLRELAGKTQLDVELDANLGSGYLQRVESGKVQRPERETLERILTALGARYTDRRDILELFGYIVDAPLPTADEINWAVSLCQADLDSAVFPVYVLDCGHRLLIWNRVAAELLNFNASKRSVSMLRLLFDAAYGLTPRISNADTFFPASIRALRTEKQLFHNESWYESLIGDLRQTCPLFEHYWSQPAAQPIYPARPLTPLEVTLPAIGALPFRVISEPFTQDRRFRVIYLLPADPPSMKQCLAWSSSNRL